VVNVANALLSSSTQQQVGNQDRNYWSF